MSTPSIKFYGLSTCIHCKHAREFLEEKKVVFDPCYVDLLQGDERAGALDAIRSHNKSLSFPTIIIGDGARVVVGYRPEELAEALGL